jgi:hypothetical protein
VHACHGNRSLAWLAIIDSDDSSSVYAPGNFVFVLAGGDAGIAVDATVSIAEKFHPSHGCAPQATVI